MKRVLAKPKKTVSARTELSKTRDSAGDFGVRLRADAKVSSAVRASKSARDFPATRKSKVAHSDPRVMEYAEVLAHAVDIFGSRIRANAWLNRPSRIFNNQSPLQVLTQDPAAVEEELVRIDEGIFY